MSPHVWIQDDESDPEIGLMVNFDDEPTPEAIAVFEELARWISDEKRAGRDPFAGTNLELAATLTEAEAAEDCDAQMARIQRLRGRAGLDQ